MSVVRFLGRTNVRHPDKSYHRTTFDFLDKIYSCMNVCCKECNWLQFSNDTSKECLSQMNKLQWRHPFKIVILHTKDASQWLSRVEQQQELLSHPVDLGITHWWEILVSWAYSHVHQQWMDINAAYGGLWNDVQCIIVKALYTVQWMKIELRRLRIFTINCSKTYKRNDYPCSRYGQR